MVEPPLREPIRKYRCEFVRAMLWAYMTRFEELHGVLKELRETGDTKVMTQQEWVASRQEVEDLISHTEFYEIEAATVEARQKADEATRR